MSKIKILTAKEIEELGYAYEELYELLRGKVDTKDGLKKSDKAIELISLAHHIIKHKLKGVRNQSSVLKEIWEDIEINKKYCGMYFPTIKTKINLWGSIYYLIMQGNSKILKDRCLTCLANKATRAKDNAKLFKPFQIKAEEMSPRQKTIIFRAILLDYIFAIEPQEHHNMEYFKFFQHFTGIDINYIRKQFDSTNMGESDIELLKKYQDLFPRFEES